MSVTPGTAYLLDDEILERVLMTGVYEGKHVLEVYLDQFVCQEKENKQMVKDTDGHAHTVRGMSDYPAHAARVGFKCPKDSHEGRIAAFFGGHLHLAWFSDNKLQWVVRNLAMVQFALPVDMLANDYAYINNPRFVAGGLIRRGNQEKHVCGSTPDPNPPIFVEVPLRPSGEPNANGDVFPAVSVVPGTPVRHEDKTIGYVVSVQDDSRVTVRIPVSPENKDFQERILKGLDVPPDFCRIADEQEVHVKLVEIKPNSGVPGVVAIQVDTLGMPVMFNMMTDSGNHNRALRHAKLLVKMLKGPKE